MLNDSTARKKKMGYTNFKRLVLKFIRKIQAMSKQRDTVEVFINSKYLDTTF